MAEPLSLDHARLELKRIGGADSALKILKRACGGGGLRDAAVIAHSTALILASCAQDGAAAVEIGAAASWATVVTTVFAQDEAAGSSVDAATRALVQRLLADAITSVASVSEAASPLRSALMSAADTGRPPLAVLAAGLRQQLRALGEAPASPDAAPHMEGTTVAQWPASRPATRPGSGCEARCRTCPPCAPLSHPARPALAQRARGSSQRWARWLPPMRWNPWRERAPSHRLPARACKRARSTPPLRQRSSMWRRGKTGPTTLRRHPPRTTGSGRASAT